MTDQTKPKELSGEGLGVTLFFIGIVPLVLVGVALFKGPPTSADSAQGVAAIAARLVRAFGVVPSLLLFGGLSGIGATMYLGVTVKEVGKHLLGLAGVSLGLAAVLSAFSSMQGGLIGDALGGSLAKGLGVWAGALVGLVIIGATVVFAWMGGKIPTPTKVGGGATLSAALNDLDRDGVSNAETHALAPDASTLEYMEELWSGNRDTVQVEPVPPSPYPEDVRLKGEVPEGAARLVVEADEAKESATEEKQAPSVAPVQKEVQPTSSEDPATQSHWKRTPQAEPTMKIKPVEALTADPAVEEVSAPTPLETSVTGSGHADDPFGLHTPEEKALADLIGLEGDKQHIATGGEWPDGVKPLQYAESEEEIQASSTQPPRPVWEQSGEAETPQAEPSQDEPAEVAEEIPAEETEALKSTADNQVVEDPLSEAPEIVEEADWGTATDELAEQSVPAPETPDDKLGRLERNWMAEWEGRMAQPASDAEEGTQVEDAAAPERSERELEIKVGGVLLPAVLASEPEEASEESSEGGALEEAFDSALSDNVTAEEVDQDLENALEEIPEIAEEDGAESADYEDGFEDLENAVAADEESEEEESDEEAELEEEADEEEAFADDEEEVVDVESDEETDEVEEGEYEEGEYEDEEAGEEEAEGDEDDEGEEEYEYVEVEVDEDGNEIEVVEGEYEDDEEEEDSADPEEGEYEEEDEDGEEDDEDVEYEYVEVEVDEDGNEIEVGEDEEDEGEYEEGEYEDEEEGEYEDEEVADGEDEDEDAEYEYEEVAEDDEEVAEGPDDEVLETVGEALEDEEAELDDGEPEVEIEPAASSKTPGSRGKKWKHADLVREAGAFLIKRDRVGVSLLQREFALEFEAASELLTEFEEVGLIGPYMGGKKRAILLDLDAWLERSPSA